MSNPAGLNINDLKQLSQLMSSDPSVQPIPHQMPQKIIKKVKIQSPPVSESSDTHIQKIPQQTSPQQTVPEQTQQIPQPDLSPNFELMGYVVNKHTVYLLIILILIGVGIWFMTSEKDKKENKKDKKENKKDKKDDQDDDQNNQDDEKI